MSKLQDFIRKNIKLPENVFTRVQEDGVAVGYHDFVFWISESYASELSADELKSMIKSDLEFLEKQRK